MIRVDANYYFIYIFERPTNLLKAWRALGRFARSEATGDSGRESARANWVRNSSGMFTWQDKLSQKLVKNAHLARQTESETRRDCHKARQSETETRLNFSPGETNRVRISSGMFTWPDNLSQKLVWIFHQARQTESESRPECSPGETYSVYIS